MTEEEWKELEGMSLDYTLKPSNPRFLELLKKTEKVHEHPEWYEQACYCRLCMSYM